MNNRLNVKEAAGIFSQSPFFSLIYHQNPDGDCLGSCLALYYWLKQGQKQVEIIDDHHLIPNAFKSDFNSVNFVTSDQASPDSLLVLLDCAEPKRTTIHEPERFFTSRAVLVIDHHKSAQNTTFKALIDTNAAATGEILTQIFREIPEWKNAMSDRFCYVAIASDTNFFRYANTTAKAMREAADLNQAPAEIDLAYFQNSSIEDTRYLGRVLSRLQQEEGILYSWITSEELSVLQPNEKPAEILEYLQKIQGVHVILLFKEAAPGKWRISLRQKGLNVDLAHFAEKFAGGGHKDAAAFALRGDLEEIKSRVLSAWKENHGK